MNVSIFLCFFFPRNIVIGGGNDDNNDDDKYSLVVAIYQSLKDHRMFFYFSKMAF